MTVTESTKLIEGVTCLVVNDLVEEDGLPIEDTDDWYAQDVDGNVWYCGEIAQNFEVFEGDDPEEAELVDVDGSWKTGRDGAQPGIIMLASPQVGDVYRQELALGEAEDAARVISTTGSATVPAASCDRRLRRDPRLHAARARRQREENLRSRRRPDPRAGPGVRRPRRAGRVHRAMSRA